MTTLADDRAAIRSGCLLRFHGQEGHWTVAPGRMETCMGYTWGRPYESVGPFPTVFEHMFLNGLHTLYASRTAAWHVTRAMMISHLFIMLDGTIMHEIALSHMRSMLPGDTMNIENVQLQWECTDECQKAEPGAHISS